MSETTALGAAFAAGLAVGVWKDTDELSKTWSLGQEYESTMAAEKRDKVRCVTCMRWWTICVAEAAAALWGCCCGGGVFFVGLRMVRKALAQEGWLRPPREVCSQNGGGLLELSRRGVKKRRV